MQHCCMQHGTAGCHGSTRPVANTVEGSEQHQKRQRHLHAYQLADYLVRHCPVQACKIHVMWCHELANRFTRRPVQQ